jgi:hypothetical protein
MTHNNINVETLAFIIFRERLSCDVKSLLRDAQADKKYWNKGNPRFWDYWVEKVSDKSKRHYIECAHQYLSEKDGADFRHVMLPIPPAESPHTCN